MANHPIPTGTGSVYVIGPVDGPYKIGRSTDPRARMSAVQSGHPSLLVLHHAEPMTERQSYYVEKEAHRTLAGCRLNGEWFGCGLDEAIQAVQRAVEAVRESPLVDLATINGEKHKDTQLYTNPRLTPRQRRAALAYRSLFSQAEEEASQMRRRGRPLTIAQAMDDLADIHRAVRERLDQTDVMLLVQIVGFEKPLNRFAAGPVRGRLRDRLRKALDVVADVAA